MTSLIVTLVLVALAVGFAAGSVWQASRTAHNLARLTPQQLRQLAERTARLRR